MLLLLLEIGLIIGFVVSYFVTGQWSSGLLSGMVVVLGLLVIYHKSIGRDWHMIRTRPSDWLRHVWEEWGKPLVAAGILALLIRTFLFGPYKIPTGSMIPTFMIGDRIFVDKISYRFNPPQRGDIIVFKYPEDRKKDFVKRLVGLPGDVIEIRDFRLIVNGEVVEEAPFVEHRYYHREDWEYGKRGQKIQVPKGHYFVLGDNSNASSDSRNWGFVPAKDLVGKAFFIWWPPKRVKLVD